MQLPLQHIRVLDFGRYIAGPYCAALLAYMGADVIRIERPGGGEDRYIAPVTAGGEGGMFLQMNANKRSLTLNLSAPAAKPILQKLIGTADVVVANLPPRTLRHLGLDYASLCEAKPDIILATNTAYGSKGEQANKIGFDGIAQAMSGASFMSGWPGQPVKAAVQYNDFGSAMASALGIMGALFQRQMTGKGQVVETSLLATGLTLTNGQLIEQAVATADRVPEGNRAQLAAPADLFPTKDGHIVVQVVGPYIFKRFARLMGQEAWLDDPRFADDAGRGDERDYLCGVMAAWCAELTTAEALAQLEAAKVPAGPVLTFQQALDHPMIQTLDFLKATDYPGLPGPAPVAGAPFHLNGSDPLPHKRAPLAGEHNTTILEALGYSESAIQLLRDNGTI